MYTIHTSVMLDGRGASYAPAYITGQKWDLAKLIDYIARKRDGEVGLIYSDLLRGGRGRIALAIDGKETIAYEVTASYTKGVHFAVERGELRNHLVFDIGGSHA